MMNVKEIERAAIKGDIMPDDLSSPDQLLYLSFRQLYVQFRNGTITKEQGSAEKNKLLAAHGLATFYYNCYIDTAKMRERISSQLTEVERCGCEHCKKTIRLFDGRDKTYDKIPKKEDT